MFQSKLKYLFTYFIAVITHKLWFYDRWAGDIALTSLSGRQVATDILLATYGW